MAALPSLAGRHRTNRQRRGLRHVLDRSPRMGAYPANCACMLVSRPSPDRSEAATTTQRAFSGTTTGLVSGARSERQRAAASSHAILLVELLRTEMSMLRPVGSPAIRSGRLTWKSAEIACARPGVSREITRCSRVLLVCCSIVPLFLDVFWIRTLFDIRGAPGRAHTRHKKPERGQGPSPACEQSELRSP